ncbi:MAG: flagellin [Alphaproteobacteria bacterium]
MTMSVNTNTGAMIALQNLNATNRSLSEVQNRINTGMKVASAKDDGAIFAIAQKMRRDVSSLGVVRESLDRVMSTNDVAIAAGEAISDLLVEMKEKALAASDESIDSASRSALNEDFTALRDQIATITQNASFNNVNLVDGSVSNITALASANGSSTITVNSEDLTLSGSTITITASTQISSQSGAASVVSAIDTSIENVNNSLARLGTASKKLEVHDQFVSRLSDSLKSGIGNLVDADLAVESARLQSLQTKQQLGTQALSIANQAPQSILSLFG